MNATESIADALPWAHGPYSIKRYGATITNCDTEPVQTPGCIQPHGALLVLRPSDLSILQASENTGRWLGQSPEQLLGQSVGAAIGPRREARLREFLASEPTECNPLHVFSVPAEAGGSPLDVSAQTIDGVVVLEFEATGRSGADAEPDYYAMIKKTVIRLQSAETLHEFCQLLAEVARGLTGLDRAMVYRFHRDGSGEVFAESKRDDLATWVGQHYPAEDIPKPARDIFRKIWVRPVPEISAVLQEIVPLANPDTGKPLDMTYCSLRGPSVMYTEYLQNMHVTAALTMPIRSDRQLWGMIACHHYSGPARIPYQVRAACEFLAQVASLQRRAVEDREHAAYRLDLEQTNQALIVRAAKADDLAVIVDGSPSLLDGIKCGGAALYHHDRWWRVGETPGVAQLDALAEWLDGRPEFDSATRPAFVTDSLAREYPPGGEFADIGSGVLAFPFSRAQKKLILWFRPETIRTVTWAGNPHDKPTTLGPNGPRLTPRASFELWTESVRQRSLPWTETEIDAAARFRLLVMDLVASRADRLSALNNELSRSNEELDSFAYVASHDLKEPLRGIHKQAYQLLHSGSLAPEDLKRTEVVVRLASRMDSLLDSLLLYSRVGRIALEFEDENLQEVVAEAIEMVHSRTEDSPVEIVVPRPLPVARCDRVRIREVFVNLLSNAMKYNDKPTRRIEIGFISPGEPGERPGCPIGAAGHTIYYVRDNGIGIQPRHFDQVFKIFKRIHGRDEYGGGTGIGLTIVQKLVDRHGGRVWIDSIPGEGTTFYFTLPCQPREES
jgi:light-regulated signal transduction histidine kinase (bacteriophytochrome)